MRKTYRPINPHEFRKYFIKEDDTSDDEVEVDFVHENNLRTTSSSNISSNDSFSYSLTTLSHLIAQQQQRQLQQDNEGDHHYHVEQQPVYDVHLDLTSNLNTEKVGDDNHASVYDVSNLGIFYSEASDVLMLPNPAFLSSELNDGRDHNGNSENQKQPATPRCLAPSSPSSSHHTTSTTISSSKNTNNNDISKNAAFKRFNDQQFKLTEPFGVSLSEFPHYVNASLVSKLASLFVLLEQQDDVLRQTNRLNYTEDDIAMMSFVASNGVGGCNETSDGWGRDGQLVFNLVHALESPDPYLTLSGMLRGVGAEESGSGGGSEAFITAANIIFAIARVERANGGGLSCIKKIQLLLQIALIVPVLNDVRRKRNATKKGEWQNLSRASMTLFASYSKESAHGQSSVEVTPKNVTALLEELTSSIANADMLEEFLVARDRPISVPSVYLESEKIFLLVDLASSIFDALPSSKHPSTPIRDSINKRSAASSFTKTRDNYRLLTDRLVLSCLRSLFSAEKKLSRSFTATTTGAGNHHSQQYQPFLAPLGFQPPPLSLCRQKEALLLLKLYCEVQKERSKVATQSLILTSLGPSAKLFSVPLLSTNAAASGSDSPRGKQPSPTSRFEKRSGSSGWGSSSGTGSSKAASRQNSANERREGAEAWDGVKKEELYEDLNLTRTVFSHLVKDDSDSDKLRATLRQMSSERIIKTTPTMNLLVNALRCLNASNAGSHQPSSIVDGVEINTGTRILNEELSRCIQKGNYPPEAVQVTAVHVGLPYSIIATSTNNVLLMNTTTQKVWMVTMPLFSPLIEGAFSITGKLIEGGGTGGEGGGPTISTSTLGSAAVTAIGAALTGMGGGPVVSFSGAGSQNANSYNITNTNGNSEHGEDLNVVKGISAITSYKTGCMDATDDLSGWAKAGGGVMGNASFIKKVPGATAVEGGEGLNEMGRFGEKKSVVTLSVPGEQQCPSPIKAFVSELETARVRDMKISSVHGGTPLHSQGLQLFAVASNGTRMTSVAPLAPSASRPTSSSLKSSKEKLPPSTSSSFLLNDRNDDEINSPLINMEANRTFSEVVVFTAIPGGHGKGLPKALRSVLAMPNPYQRAERMQAEERKFTALAGTAVVKNKKKGDGGGGGGGKKMPLKAGNATMLSGGIKKLMSEGEGVGMGGGAGGGATLFFGDKNDAYATFISNLSVIASISLHDVASAIIKGFIAKARDSYRLATSVLTNNSLIDGIIRSLYKSEEEKLFGSSIITRIGRHTVTQIKEGEEVGGLTGGTGARKGGSTRDTLLTTNVMNADAGTDGGGNCPDGYMSTALLDKHLSIPGNIHKLFDIRFLKDTNGKNQNILPDHQHEQQSRLTNISQTNQVKYHHAISESSSSIYSKQNNFQIVCRITTTEIINGIVAHYLSCIAYEKLNQQACAVSNSLWGDATGPNSFTGITSEEPAVTLHTALPSHGMEEPMMGMREGGRGALSITGGSETHISRLSVRELNQIIRCIYISEVKLSPDGCYLVIGLNNNNVLVVASIARSCYGAYEGNSSTTVAAGVDEKAKTTSTFSRCFDIIQVLVAPQSSLNDNNNIIITNMTTENSANDKGDIKANVMHDGMKHSYHSSNSSLLSSPLIVPKFTFMCQKSPAPCFSTSSSNLSMEEGQKPFTIYPLPHHLSSVSTTANTSSGRNILGCGATADSGTVIDTSQPYLYFDCETGKQFLRSTSYTPIEGAFDTLLTYTHSIMIAWCGTNVLTKALLSLEYVVPRCSSLSRTVPTISCPWTPTLEKDSSSSLQCQRVPELPGAEVVIPSLACEENSRAWTEALYNVNKYIAAETAKLVVGDEGGGASQFHQQGTSGKEGGGKSMGGGGKTDISRRLLQASDVATGGKGMSLKRDNVTLEEREYQTVAPLNPAVLEYVNHRCINAYLVGNGLNASVSARGIESRSGINATGGGPARPLAGKGNKNKTPILKNESNDISCSVMMAAATLRAAFAMGIRQPCIVAPNFNVYSYRTQDIILPSFITTVATNISGNNISLDNETEGIFPYIGVSVPAATDGKGGGSPSFTEKNFQITPFSSCVSNNVDLNRYLAVGCNNGLVFIYDSYSHHNGFICCINEFGYRMGLGGNVPSNLVRNTFEALDGIPSCLGNGWKQNLSNSGNSEKNVVSSSHSMEPDSGNIISRSVITTYEELLHTKMLIVTQLCFQQGRCVAYDPPLEPSPLLSSTFPSKVVGLSSSTSYPYSGFSSDPSFINSSTFTATESSALLLLYVLIRNTRSHRCYINIYSLGTGKMDGQHRGNARRLPFSATECSFSSLASDSMLSSSSSSVMKLCSIEDVFHVRMIAPIGILPLVMVMTETKVTISDSDEEGSEEGAVNKKKGSVHGVGLKRGDINNSINNSNRAIFTSELMKKSESDPLVGDGGVAALQRQQQKNYQEAAPLQKLSLKRGNLINKIKMRNKYATFVFDATEGALLGVLGASGMLHCTSISPSHPTQEDAFLSGDGERQCAESTRNSLVASSPSAPSTLADKREIRKLIPGSLRGVPGMHGKGPFPKKSIVPSTADLNANPLAVAPSPASSAHEIRMKQIAHMNFILRESLASALALSQQIPPFVCFHDTVVCLHMDYWKWWCQDKNRSMQDSVKNSISPRSHLTFSSIVTFSEGGVGGSRGGQVRQRANDNSLLLNHSHKPTLTIAATSRNIIPFSLHYIRITSQIMQRWYPKLLSTNIYPTELFSQQQQIIKMIPMPLSVSKDAANSITPKLFLPTPTYMTETLSHNTHISQKKNVVRATASTAAAVLYQSDPSARSKDFELIAAFMHYYPHSERISGTDNTYKAFIKAIAACVTSIDEAYMKICEPGEKRKTIIKRIKTTSSMLPSLPSLRQQDQRQEQNAGLVNSSTIVTPRRVVRMFINNTITGKIDPSKGSTTGEAFTEEECLQASRYISKNYRNKSSTILPATLLEWGGRQKSLADGGIAIGATAASSVRSLPLPPPIGGLCSQRIAATTATIFPTYLDFSLQCRDSDLSRKRRSKQLNQTFNILTQFSEAADLNAAAHRRDKKSNNNKNEEA